MLSDGVGVGGTIVIVSCSLHVAHKPTERKFGCKGHHSSLGAMGGCGGGVGGNLLWPDCQNYHPGHIRRVPGYASFTATAAVQLYPTGEQS